MTVRDLIAALERYPLSHEVTVLCGGDHIYETLRINPGEWAKTGERFVCVELGELK